MPTIAVRHRVLRALLVVVALPIAEMEARAQSAPYVGCYRIAVGPWTRVDGTEASSGPGLPASVRLSEEALVARPGQAAWFVMRSAPGVPEAEFENASWHVRVSDTVEVRWETTPFGGVRATLVRANEDGVVVLRGTATYWSDDMSTPTLRSPIALTADYCHGRP